MSEKPWRVHVLVHGRVQGVFFRASTREQAGLLGLVGWVRNLPDGSVEIVAEGERRRLEQLLQWCRQGPPGARVEKLEDHWEEAGGEFTDFGIRY